MKIARQTQMWLGTRLAGHDGVRKSWCEFAQAKAAVESVGGFCEVAACVLGLADRVIDAADGAFDVGKHDIDPARAGNFGGGATAAGFEHGVRMAGIDDATEAAETIGEGLGVGCQTPLDPVGECSVVEGSDGLDHGTGRMVEVGIGLDGDQERLLVFGAASGLAAIAFAAEIGVVDLHEALEFPRFLALGHRLHDLVFEAPRAAVAEAKVTFQFERRHVGLGRRQQVDRQEPGRQRQLRVLKQRAGNQGRLMLASATLIDRLRTAPEARSPSISARWTAKSLRPARPVQCSTTLRFTSVLTKKLGHRQPRLELDQVHAHRRAPQVRSVRIPRQRLRSRDFELRFGANQVVFWTQQFSIAMNGDVSLMRSYAAHQVNVMNEVFQNSGVSNVTVRMVNAKLSGRIDSGDYNSDLNGIRLDQFVQDDRNSYFADIVVQIGEQSPGGIAGVAYGNSNPTSGESIAFAVMYHQADLGGLTFAHEVGHVLGMAHHYQSSGFTPPYPWSYGHVAYPDASHTMGFVTTMAYTGFCGGSPPCFKVPYYSNPAITIGADPVQGRPIGNSSNANNAQTATLVAPIVAGYRSPPPPLFADGFES